ncbi:MAG: hypothetical protein NPIRA02_29360 [Nitrospirales bacterium]|nr:MAG: hypothetical protein NPIRA02_29360 [Nitrospirales bacterium]
MVLKSINLKTMKRSTKDLKDTIVAAKFTPDLVNLLDRDARYDSTSRSHILRRIVLNHYRDRELVCSDTGMTQQ